MTEHAELSESREDVLETIAQPERILAGNHQELLAVKEIDIGKWMIVVYREFEADGFIITAFWARRQQSLNKRTVLWSQ